MCFFVFCLFFGFFADAYVHSTRCGEGSEGGTLPNENAPNRNVSLDRIMSFLAICIFDVFSVAREGNRLQNGGGLEPSVESHQIDALGNGFVDFWSQGQKIIKSGFLRMVLSSSASCAFYVAFCTTVTVATQWPHSGHTVATQWPLVKTGDLVISIKKNKS